MTAEDRHKYTETILRHYYDKLTELLGKTPPFTFEQVQEAYERCFSSAAIPIIGVLPTFTKIAGLLEENSQEKEEEIMRRTEALIEDVLKVLN